MTTEAGAAAPSALKHVAGAANLLVTVPA